MDVGVIGGLGDLGLDQFWSNFVDVASFWSEIAKIRKRFNPKLPVLFHLALPRPLTCSFTSRLQNLRSNFGSKPAQPAATENTSMGLCCCARRASPGSSPASPTSPASPPRSRTDTLLVNESDATPNQGKKRTFRSESDRIYEPHFFS